MPSEIQHETGKVPCWKILQAFGQHRGVPPKFPVFGFHAQILPLCPAINLGADVVDFLFVVLNQ